MHLLNVVTDAAELALIGTPWPLEFIVDKRGTTVVTACCSEIPTPTRSGQLVLHSCMTCNSVLFTAREEVPSRADCQDEAPWIELLIHDYYTDPLAAALDAATAATDIEEHRRSW